MLQVEQLRNFDGARAQHVGLAREIIAVVAAP
jgi:hypothetical protein